MRLLCFLVFTVPFLLVSCSTTSMVKVDTLVPVNRSMEDVRYALQLSANQYDWRIESDTPGSMVLKLDTRSHMVKVKIKYSAKKYKITYMDSNNMNYDPKTQTIRRNYNKWILNLDKYTYQQLSSPSFKRETTLPYSKAGKNVSTKSGKNKSTR